MEEALDPIKCAKIHLKYLMSQARIKISIIYSDLHWDYENQAFEVGVGMALDMLHKCCDFFDKYDSSQKYTVHCIADNHHICKNTMINACISVYAQHDLNNEKMIKVIRSLMKDLIVTEYGII